MGTIISQEISYSATTLSQQSTPIGAIIPYMGTTAPSGYLACDGGVYNISLYPLLAGFFEAQFGSINYFGGDGTSTFAVPNLQGEFLRGAGTNSHANQGSGRTVGEHQDGTILPNIAFDTVVRVYTPSDNAMYLENADSTIKQATKGRNTSATSAAEWSSSTFATATSRPTNTSVLYIIKAKSDHLDKITFAEVDDTSVSSDAVWSAEKTREAIGPESYSTSEQWTGKYWIDRKKIYQKSYVITSNINNSGWNAVPHGITGGVDRLINAWGGYTFSVNSTKWTNINGYFRDAGCLIDVSHANGGDTEMGISDSSRTITEAHWTLQYTKITN